MKKFQILIFLMLAMASATNLSAKTLVVYYSYTGKCHQIVETLLSQIEADTVRIYPADKTQKYEANNYAIGTQLLNAIKADPYNADSYPAIDPVEVSLADYDTYIIVTPLWWSQMAAILQTYLFHHGSEMAGKNVGLIVSSYSSGISGVVTDAKRLVPEAEWMSENLWINNASHANRASKIQTWLETVDYQTLVSPREPGDVNGDKSVDVADVAVLIDHILGKNPLPFYSNLANLNDDSKVDVADVTALINIILGK